MLLREEEKVFTTASFPILIVNGI